MANLSQVRILLELTRRLAPHLNDEEITAIGIVLTKAIQRLEKESEE